METGMHETTGENNLEKTSKTASQLSMTTRLRCLKKDGLFGLLVSVHDGSAPLLRACDETKAHHDGEGTKGQAALFRTAGRRNGKKGGKQCWVASSNDSLCNSLKLSLVPHVKDFLFLLHPNGVRLEAKPSTQGLGKTAQIPTTVNLPKKLPHAKTYHQLCLQLSGWTWASAHGKWDSMMPEQTWD